MAGYDTANCQRNEVVLKTLLWWGRGQRGSERRNIELEGEMGRVGREGRKQAGNGKMLGEGYDGRSNGGFTWRG